jgi:hypothetical protein
VADPSLDAGEDRPGAVRRAVVHGNDLGVQGTGGNPSNDLLDRPFFTEGEDDDAHEHVGNLRGTAGMAAPDLSGRVASVSEGHPLSSATRAAVARPSDP